MFNDFALKVVVSSLLPASILDNFREPSKYDYLIDFIKQALSTSAIYVKGPEVFLRIFLFLLIFLLKFLQLVTFKFVTVEFGLRKISKIHPILDDGMRLYILLAMFAAFEENSVRMKNGFLPIEDIVTSYKNLNHKS